MNRPDPAPDALRRAMLERLGCLGVAALLPACGGGGGSEGGSGSGASSASASSAASSTAASSSATSSSRSASSSSASSSRASSTSASSGGSTQCTAIPDETAGPYPGDGSNSNASGVVNVLTQSGVVRQDITRSFGTASGVADGVALSIQLTLTDSNCSPLSGYAVYLWHCTRDGNYSLYSSGITAENYLRGVQVSDASGLVTFTSIFPGCYSGRWPHIHFEIYPSLSVATSGSYDVKTSQLALPSEACNTVYNAVSGYSASIANFKAITLATDNVFGNDSAALQLATVSGSVAAGYTASLQVSISA